MKGHPAIQAFRASPFFRDLSKSFRWPKPWLSPSWGGEDKAQKCWENDRLVGAWRRLIHEL
jgi:hypothetical protein